MLFKKFNIYLFKRQRKSIYLQPKCLSIGRDLRILTTTVKLYLSNWSFWFAKSAFIIPRYNPSHSSYVVCVTLWHGEIRQRKSIYLQLKRLSIGRYLRISTTTVKLHLSNWSFWFAKSTFIIRHYNPLHSSYVVYVTLWHG